MRVWNIGIVGGGPGGLMTAYALQKAADRPHRITLFEASDRLGGKILTPRFKAANVHYEAGAAEFYDYSQFDDDPLKELVLELGLPISPMGGPAVIMHDRVLANLDDVRDALGSRACEALRAFDRNAKDNMTPQEFYHSDYPEGAAFDGDPTRFDTTMAAISDPETSGYVMNMIHSDLATEPARTSAAYGLQNYLMNDPAYMHLYGIEGGNERLPRELAARIDADFRLRHRAVSVAKTADGLMRVESEHDGRHVYDDFDAVVIALPHNHLASIRFEDERLTDAVRAHADFYDHPAHYLRITILFDRPFWQGTLGDSYWMLDRFGGCCLYDESSREPGQAHGILGWLLGGENALELSGLSDESLISAALDSLPAPLAAGRDHFVEGRIHRWIKAVNALPGGVIPRSHDRRHRPDPIEHPRLFFVGDYLFDSTLNGVLDSANYVAAWIAADMTDTP